MAPCFVWFRVLLCDTWGEKKLRTFFFFFCFSLTTPSPFFIRMKLLKVTKATAIQANREWCVVKLKQMLSIIDLAPTIF